MTENNPTNQNSSEKSQNKFQSFAESDLLKNSSQISPDDLLTRLTQAIKDLFYISETDAAFEAFVWQRDVRTEAFSDVNAADILRFAGNAPDTAFREQSLEDFFRFPTTQQDWQSADEKEIVKRYVKLKELIKQELCDSKVVKIGEIEIEGYIVGITEDGNLAGVKTQAVET